jgi:hypothetical protein
MTTRHEYTDIGTLADIICKMEDMRDSLAEILEELEGLEEGYSSYATDAPYGLPLDEENGNGD